MNPSAAPNVDKIEKQKEVMGEVVEALGKCILLNVRNVAKIQKSPFSRGVINPFTVATVIAK